MKVKMEIRVGQIPLICIWGLIAIIAFSNAYARDYTIDLTGGQSFDLLDETERAELLNVLQHDPSVPRCEKKAKYVVQLMTERDAGITKEEHLQRVREKYENTKQSPEGAIQWHVYIDFGRMVRDVHRSAGVSSDGGYRHTDANVLWAHEFTQCLTPYRGGY